MKGPKNAWREREQRKKHITKIATLKKYAKLVKKEGIVSDRVRINNPQHAVSNDSVEQSPEKASSSYKDSRLASSSTESTSAHRQNKPTHQQQQSAKKQLTNDDNQAQREQFFAERHAEKEEALKRRKEMHKIMTKRTSKGQPVMAGRIKNILGKLMTEVGGQK